MGNYNLKSGILRCDNCYSILKMTINPSYPDVYVNLDCKCVNAKLPIKNMLTELKKGIPFKIFCNKCKKEDKNSKYCHDCNHIYCHSCIKEHQKHKTISVNKADYYCVYHNKEIFVSYCHDCSMNFCKKCIEEKKHLNHNCCELNSMNVNKNDRNYLKDKFKLAERKLEYTSQFIHAFSKKLINEKEKNEIINTGKNNLSQNKYILELINFFIYFYDNTKLKNYNIIYNVTENINLNVNKFKFVENNVSLEDAYRQLLDYLQNDYIIFRSDKDGNNYRRRNSKNGPNIWEYDNYSEYDTTQTLAGPNIFDLNLTDNFDTMNYTSRKNTNLNNANLYNSVNTNYSVHDVNDNDYYRPRSHAVFIPTKVAQDKLKKINEKVNEEENNDDKINEKENDDDNDNENDNIEENIKINEEKKRGKHKNRGI
jgi:hypothetical protein